MLIQTSDPNDFGTLTFDLTISPSTISSPAAPIVITYTVNLARCQIDEIIQTGVITNFEYELGSGPVLIAPQLEGSFAECLPTFALT